MIKGLILIGGKSSRMGTEKYLLDINGKPQYQFLYNLLTKFGIPTFISCNKKQAKSLDPNYELLMDQYDSIGPINGIVSAFEFDSQSSWFVVACDLIHLTEPTFEQLIQMNDKTFDAVTYQKKGGSFFETTLTIYNPGVRKYIQSAIESKNYSLQDILRKCKVKTIEVRDADFLQNANTQSDL